MTQTDNHQINGRIEKLQHKHMAFPRGNLTEAQRSCTTYENEVFAIVQPFDRVDYFLLGPQQVHVLSDQRSLLYSLPCWHFSQIFQNTYRLKCIDGQCTSHVLNDSSDIKMVQEIMAPSYLPYGQENTEMLPWKLEKLKRYNSVWFQAQRTQQRQI